MWKTATGAIATIVAAILLIPAASDAAVYKWNVNGGGNWTVPANWQRVSGDPCVHQIPNCVGDEAVFPSTLTASTNVIDIPAGVTITIGAITVYSSNTTINISGDRLANTSKLVFATPTGGPALLRHFGTGAGFFSNKLYLDVAMEVQSNIAIMTSPNTLVQLWTVAESGQRTMTKSGAGELVFRKEANHSGGTRVEDGVLHLEAAEGSKYGSFEIGDGLGDAESAQVITVNRFYTADIVVNNDGFLRFVASGDVRTLRMNDGSVRVTGTRNVRLGDLTMTGGVLFSEGGVFNLKGDVTATSSQTGPARMEAANNTAKFELDTPGALRTFTVNDGPGAVDLRISVQVSGLAAGLLKEGAGVIRFAGSASNTYVGDTRVRGGRVELARDADAIVVPGRLEIGALGEVHVLSGLVRQNIADTAAVSIAAGGLLKVSADETIGSLTMDPGGRVIIEPHSNGSTANLRTTSLSMIGGRITVDGTLHLKQKIAATSSATENGHARRRRQRLGARIARELHARSQ